MLKHRALVALATAAVASLPVAAMNFAPITASASSHREAPTIANDPTADNTDVYAFASPDDPNNSLPDVQGQRSSPRDAGTVTLVANYIPFQSPNGGPNFYRFADDVLYEIHIDNQGNAADDVVYQFQFNTTTVSDQTFLYNTGKMTWNGTAYANWNRPQTYSVTKVTNGVVAPLGTGLLTPPVDVGPHSVGTTADYHNLVSHSIHTLVNNKGTVFAGQRADPFFVDLGAVFDLLSVVPQGHNYLQGENVNSIVLKIPKSEIGDPNKDHVMGVWATAKRKTTQIINANGSRTSSGAEVQVSRLGNPLVNEVVIPLGLKDAFNGLAPANDGTVPGAVNAVKTPELPKLFRALGIDANAPLSNRGDLFATFLQGLDGLNKPKPLGIVQQVPGEMLRLNYDIAPSTSNPNTVNRLAALAGQLDGFPNGRRLADDVTDIELSAADGILCDPTRSAALPLTFKAQFIADGQVGPTCRSTDAPILGDGVNTTDQPFQTTFPYVADPYQGHN